MCLATCTAIPYRVSVVYGGASANYDGKRVTVALDAKNLKGYQK